MEEYSLDPELIELVKNTKEVFFGPGKQGPNLLIIRPID